LRKNNKIGLAGVPEECGEAKSTTEYGKDIE